MTREQLVNIFGRRLYRRYEHTELAAWVRTWRLMRQTHTAVDTAIIMQSLGAHKRALHKLALSEG